MKRTRKVCFPGKMLELVLLLLLLPLIVCKAASIKCHMMDSFPIPNEWYQSGDFLIGEIASQLFYHLHEIDFKRHPAEELYKVP